ncbi:hypothetical protein SmJEL517_g01019 [Synchytrium microbalum]|uniref:Uncharacterized protein n=1 Tax=Synchytrium microbalum TaxID=1806994 RepID=A0A507CCR9_9FUNG|nr:uncharacterized protein SmJEL517_g01019 [Synchytrium microbalum]TPX37138.1 hypothetical protein SmJEL517_g01019 [Synchytrium microbalum]
MGFTTVLIIVIGKVFKINIPLSLIISTMCGVIVLPCALFFMRLGAFILNIERPSLNPFSVIDLTDLMGSAQRIILTIFCAALGWSLIMIPAAPIIFYSTSFLVKRTKLMSKYKRAV